MLQDRSDRTPTQPVARLGLILIIFVNGTAGTCGVRIAKVRTFAADNMHSNDYLTDCIKVFAQFAKLHAVPILEHGRFTRITLCPSSTVLGPTIC